MFVRLLLEVRNGNRDAPRASRFVRHDEHLLRDARRADFEALWQSWGILTGDLVARRRGLMTHTQSW